ncbi:MAG: hypothetical protein RLZZ584_2544 [Pseudomonadota bacterium]|jgi:hypothetical protein
MHTGRLDLIDLKHIRYVRLGTRDLAGAAHFAREMRAWYELRQRGVRIVFGPGRHPTSSAVFLYLGGRTG